MLYRFIHSYITYVKCLWEIEMKITIMLSFKSKRLTYNQHKNAFTSESLLRSLEDCGHIARKDSENHEKLIVTGKVVTRFHGKTPSIPQKYQRK